MTGTGHVLPADPIETTRLTLRRLTEDDAEFIVGLLNEPSFLQFIGDRGVRTLDDARAYIRKGPIASYERFGFGLLLVTRNEDGGAHRDVRPAEAGRAGGRRRGVRLPPGLLGEGLRRRGGLGGHGPRRRPSSV